MSKRKRKTCTYFLQCAYSARCDILRKRERELGGQIDREGEDEGRPVLTFYSVHTLLDVTD